MDPLKEAKFKNNLSNIQDTYWSHTDPSRTLQSISDLEKTQMLDEVICTFDLATATLILFATLFPELCCEVGRYANFKDHALYDVNGVKILNFSPTSIEEAFKWSNEGVVYTKRDSDYY